MNIVNMHNAKTNLSKLVAQVLEGEDVVLAKDGKPVVRLIPYAQPKRKLGNWKGKGWVADDFDAPLPDDILNAFEGKW